MVHVVVYLITDLNRTTNQFISHRVAVKPLLKAGENDLHIHFRSAFREVWLAPSPTGIII